ncbi:hypothetical protein HJG60_009676 [Phyllostomus discolor]|uniref:Uncharacterized protein n=1 Tax=Phyllostomus discolor TaxID=89673 RepID=A0A834BBX9_9CHIR|nr:hypothetical protein HJG60_009676 [Phyllostomus discolor]
MSSAEQYVIIRSQAPWPRKKGLPSELILSVRLQGACLTHFRCSRSARTMDKLITNHAYLFIKQGLGEIQRGNTVLTSFNLQSVIKRNTAARLQKRCLGSAFLLVPTDPSSRGHCQPHAGSGHHFSASRCSPAARDFGQVPSPARVSASSSVKWVRAPLASGVSLRQGRQATAVRRLFQDPARSCVVKACPLPSSSVLARHGLPLQQRPRGPLHGL